MQMPEQTKIAQVPGWYRYTWFLGRPPDLTERQWLILCGIGVVVPILFYLLFPETAGRRLQEIAPDETIVPHETTEPSPPPRSVVEK